MKWNQSRKIQLKEQKINIPMWSVLEGFLLYHIYITCSNAEQSQSRRIEVSTITKLAGAKKSYTMKLNNDRFNLLMV